MAIKTNKVTVADTPTLIFPADRDGAYVHIQVSGQGAIYIGDATVSATTGHNRPVDSHISLFVGPNEAIYGVTASGTVVVTYLATLNQ